MSLFRWVLVATVLAMTTTTQPAESRPPQLAVQQHESEPRVEIGEAVLTVYDESGEPTVVE